MLESLEFSLAAPSPANTVVKGDVRIQFITSRLVRLEWAANGKFEDRQTLAVLNRCVTPVELNQATDNHGWFTVSSPAMSVHIKNDGMPLSADNCRIEFQMNGHKVKWHPGMEDTRNLGSTIRTLDLCWGDRKVCCDNAFVPQWEEAVDINLGSGFLSRSGWSLIDDSHNVVVDNVDGRKWVVEREPGERSDWYFMAYGQDYKGALRDGAMVFGSQPLPPRYTLGYWWSRYWAYSDVQIEELVRSFKSMNVPIDVMVIDMDWHLEGWTGYTWDRRYFPNPDEHLAWLHKQGCKVTLNLHPANGVGRHEEQFVEMAEAMGLDPQKVDCVPFNIVDPQYMDNYFKILHHPDERRGIDFWWMDWQQGESSAMKGLDTLPWINHLHWEDMQKRGDNSRPLIFSRFGGIGAGRYNIGFSGDTYSNWESLAFQPYFTATAANVLYGYWSHDIGGHLPGEIDPELYLRWMQFGAYSPILRTHTTKNSKAERRMWAYPDPFGSLMLETIRERYALVPYIYSENRKAYDSAVSLVHPMYYEFPDAEDAYLANDQYMFGESMLVAPIVAPADPLTKLAKRRFWLPQGEWFDTARGGREVGGAWLEREYLYSEVPVFVRPGSVIPRQKCPDNLDNRCYEDLIMAIYSGSEGAYSLYEDDGVTQDYTADKCAYINMSHADSDGEKTIRVHSTGGFHGFERERNLLIELYGYAPPKRVVWQGHELPYFFRLEEAGEPAWSYDGVRGAVVINLGNVDIVAGIEVKVELNVAGDKAADGLRGWFARLKLLNYFNTIMTVAMVLHPNERLGQELSHTGYRISRAPESFDAEIANLHAKMPELREMLMALGDPSIPELRTDERADQLKSVLALLDSMRI